MINKPTIQIVFQAIFEPSDIWIFSKENVQVLELLPEGTYFFPLFQCFRDRIGVRGRYKLLDTSEKPFNLRKTGMPMAIKRPAEFLLCPRLCLASWRSKALGH